MLIKFTSTDLDRNVQNDLPFIQTRNDRNGIISLKNTQFTAIFNTKARVTSRSGLETGPVPGTNLGSYSASEKSFQS